jgi:hypothetical protein
MDNGKNNKTKWVAICASVLSFLAAVIFGAYVLGQRTGKVLDLHDWKVETAPRIERMDARGTNSFEIFHDEYLRTQARQEAKLIELEQMIRDKQLEDLKTRLVTLERKPQ